MNRLIEKLSSGRWIFTIITAYVFGYCAITKQITNEQIIAIITMIIAFYFSKSDRNTPKGV